MKLSAFALVLNFMAGVFSLNNESSKAATICETSDASPFLHHVDCLIENLQRDEKQSNICRSGMRAGKCGDTLTRWTGKAGGAVFSLCATEPDDLKLLCLFFKIDGLPPYVMSLVIKKIKGECKGNHLVGGRYKFEGGGELRLYTRPGLQRVH